MYRIAIVDDDHDVNDLFKGWILQGYPNSCIEQLFSFEDSKMAFAKQSYDLALLDVDLGDAYKIGGVTLASELCNKMTPVLIVSGAATGDLRKQMRDVMLALGAWDYITKPVEQEDLMNQIRHALSWKDGKANSSHEQSDPNLVIDPWGHAPSMWKGKRISLTLTHKKIIDRLIKNINKVVSYSELVNLLPTGKNRGNLSVHIRTIRSEISSVDPDFNRIKTYAGSGLSWEIKK